MRPRYVRQVEDFLKELRPGSLSRLTEGEVRGYLQQALNRPTFFGWKFRQLFERLQLVFSDQAQADLDRRSGQSAIYRALAGS